MNIQSLSKRILYKSEVFAEVMSVCSSLLKYSPDAEVVRNYIKTRVPSYHCNGFSFGYFPNNEQLHLFTEYLDEDLLFDLGLFYKKYVCDSGIPYATSFSILGDHNLVMPYRNLNGDIIAMVGRSLLSEADRESKNISKYKNTKFQKSLNLFGLYKAKHSILEQGYAVVVEGQFDCITCHRYGFKNVVALGGISLTKFQLYLLMRYTDTIYLLLDNDKSGQKSAEILIHRYKKIVNIRNFN